MFSKRLFFSPDNLVTCSANSWISMSLAYLIPVLDIRELELRLALHQIPDLLSQLSIFGLSSLQFFFSFDHSQLESCRLLLAHLSLVQVKLLDLRVCLGFLLVVLYQETQLFVFLDQLHYQLSKQIHECFQFLGHTGAYLRLLQMQRGKENQLHQRSHVFLFQPQTRHVHSAIPNVLGYVPHCLLYS